jgi:hypothetical protein
MILGQERGSMRFLIKATMSTEAGNKAVREGKLGAKIQAVLAELKPEAAYFMEDGGRRAALLVVNIQDVSEIPRFAEPFFLGMDAEVRFHPLMTAEDLGRAGLDELASKWGNDRQA